MDKFNVRLHIGHKIYSSVMSNMAIEEVESRGMKSKIIKLMEQCTKYTITYKQYDTEVEIMSVCPVEGDDAILQNPEDVSEFTGQNLCSVWFPGLTPGFSFSNRSSFFEILPVIVNLYNFVI